MAQALLRSREMFIPLSHLPGHGQAVWALRTTAAGTMKTKEGESHYEAGDYLVFNNEDDTDGYCVSTAKFEAMYEVDEPSPK